MIQNKVAATRAEREKNVARRRDPLTGTSEFPDIHEAVVQVLDVARHAPAASAAPATFAALPRIRLAEPFEDLRDASDRMRAATGARPKNFPGQPRQAVRFHRAHAVRQELLRGRWDRGGVNDGFSGRDAMIAAFKASGAKLACLCSSDKVYAEQAVAAARASRAPARSVYLAGRPGELEAALKDAGVCGFVFAGCDALAALKTTHGLIAS